jgi:hypothetical protein
VEETSAARDWTDVCCFHALSASLASKLSFDVFLTKSSCKNLLLLLCLKSSAELECDRECSCPSLYSGSATLQVHCSKPNLTVLSFPHSTLPTSRRTSSPLLWPHCLSFDFISHSPSLTTTRDRLQQDTISRLTTPTSLALLTRDAIF